MLDVVLDDAASLGEAAALRVASLTAQPCPARLLPAEQIIAALAHAARQTETAWQAEYWNHIGTRHRYAAIGRSTLLNRGMKSLLQPREKIGTKRRWNVVDRALAASSIEVHRQDSIALGSLGVEDYSPAHVE
jgi:hypothetical protein